MGSNSQNRQDVVGWIWLLIIALGMIELHRLIGIRFTTNDDAMGLIWYPIGLGLDSLTRCSGMVASSKSFTGH